MPSMSTFTAERLAKVMRLRRFDRQRTCWGNAIAESFYATLKLELVDRYP